MKRKTFTCILVTALLLVILAATALAAYTLLRSKQADAVSQARHALSEKYGLTPETIGLFDTQSEQQGDVWTVEFHGAGYNPALLGDYTVTLVPGKAPEARWTHDDADPAVWEDGSLDAPVWGQKQMLKALKDKDAAAKATAQFIWLWPKLSAQPSVSQTPMPLKEDEALYQGKIIREATPGPDDIPQSKALDMAKQAIAEEAPLTKETLDSADVMMTFYQRETGNPIWDIHLFFISDGIEQGWGVTLDARTGEILMTGATTGGNG
jgi:hypothetical protein